MIIKLNALFIWVLTNIFLPPPCTNLHQHAVMFEVREEAVGIGQPDSIAKYGIGESIGQAGEVLEDDYGISVKPERFVDIYPSNYGGGGGGGSGRMGGDASGRGIGFGFGADGRPTGGMPGAARGDGQVNLWFFSSFFITFNFYLGC